jgi:hypothetical protein
LRWSCACRSRRARSKGWADILLETPRGRDSRLSKIATIEDGDGPNQVSRDDGKRRIVLSANAQGRALSEIVEDIRKVVGESKLPEGYFVTLGGQFQAQEEASRLVGLLSIVSLVLMFVVLFSRYKSVTLSVLIMANIPLALVGAVLGLWISGQPLSVAALIGFITLAGISVRNGILKVSHYINLMRMEGESFNHKMIRARLAGTPGAGADDGAGDSLCAGAAVVRGRAAGHGNPASGGGGHLLRADQLDPARYLPDTRHVLAVWPQWMWNGADGRPRCPVRFDYPISWLRSQ